MMQKHIILESPNLKKEEEEEENPAVKRKGYFFVPSSFKPLNIFEHIYRVTDGRLHDRPPAPNRLVSTDLDPRTLGR